MFPFLSLLQVQTSAEEASRRIKAHGSTPISPSPHYHHLEKVGRMVGKKKRKKIRTSAVLQNCQQGPLSPPFPGKGRYRPRVVGGAALGARAAPAAPRAGLGRALGSVERWPHSCGLGGGRLQDVPSESRGVRRRIWRPRRLDTRLRYLTPRFWLMTAGSVRAGPLARPCAPGAVPLPGSPAPLAFGVFCPALHSTPVAEAHSSLPAADLHANCVWEKFFNWQN